MTHYGAGDFLSMHNDGLSGTLAFVAFLPAGPAYEQRFGGRLQFFAAKDRSWCGCLFLFSSFRCAYRAVWRSVLALEPAPRRLVVFRTRDPLGPLHAVETVRDGELFHRFGFTGCARPHVLFCALLCLIGGCVRRWYNEVGDVMTAAEQHQLNLMRNAA